MGFDFDPQEQANISAADFEIMCDEMRTLREQAGKLAEALRRVCTRDPRTHDEIDADWDNARAALAEYDRQRGAA